MTYQENYLSWVNSPYLDEESRKNLKAIENDEQEKKLRFAGSLSFGTAGLRGVMKEGTDAMNLYTVSKATQGFADYILRCGGAEKGVVIAFDCRNNSRCDQNGCNIHVFLPRSILRIIPKSRRMRWPYALP